MAALARASGDEVALVVKQDGHRVIVAGGPGGIDFEGWYIRTYIAHTHPAWYWWPSTADISTLIRRRQTFSAIIEVYDTWSQVVWYDYLGRVSF
jgi:hypothetical protein